MDIAGVTTVLLFADGIASPLIVLYPLLVAASGLWLRVPVVAFTTAAAIASYLVLVADFYWRRTSLQSLVSPQPDRHVYFVLALLLVGAAVAYQVGRARALSRFYANRRPPWLGRSG